MNKLPPFLALTLLCGTAAAEPEILSSTVVGDRIEMEISGASGYQPESFVLRDATTPRSAAFHATSVKRFAEAGGPVAIAVVYQGNETWIGNDKIITDENDPSRYLGALRGVQQTLLNLQNLHLPKGSELAVIDYADGARMREPLMPIGSFDDSDLGGQRAYYNRVGSDLVRGVERAFDQLVRADAQLKLLIVIGDGNDTDNGRAKAELAELRKRALSAHVATLGVVYKSELSDPGNVISVLDHNAHTVVSLEEMAAVVDAFVDHQTDRTYATFASPWHDGKQHGLIASLGAYDLDAEYLDVPYVAPSRFRWLGGYWQQLLAGFALIGVFALGMRIRAAKSV